MIRLVRVAAAALLTLAVAACAQTPPPDQYPNPPKKRLDAKTQLETGKTY